MTPIAKHKPNSPAIGALIHGRYRIDAPLGEGGLGMAFRARDLATGDDVALKLLTKAGSEGTELLRREFQSLLGTHHRRLTRVRDFGWWSGSGVPFYTADLVHGRALSEWTGKPLDEWRGALVDALRALHHLHRRGIRHGDFSPSNILVDERGRGVLIDLSCAGRLGRDDALPMGTPGFVAPELARGTSRVQADVFSVGALLDAMGCSELSGLASRCLRAEPDERPVSVGEVLEVLGESAEPEPWTSARAWSVVGRRRLVEQFDAALDAVSQGREGPRHIALVGEAGLGRTRLLQEMKWRAQLRLDQVFEARLGEQRPFATMLERAAGVGMSSLADVFDVRERLLATDSPTALFVDDVDRFPEAEQRLFDAFVQTIRPGDQIVVVAVEGDRSRGPAELLALEPLDERALAHWCEQVGAPAAWGKELLEETGGHVALVDAMLSSRLTSRALKIPHSAVDALRVAALPPEVAEALSYLVDLGGVIDDEVSLRLELTSPLRELETQGIAQRDGDRYRLTRSALVESLREPLSEGAAQRRERITAVLEALQPDPYRAAGLAAQLARSGDLEAARGAFVAAPTSSAKEWKAVGQLLSERSEDPEVALRHASNLLATGHASSALSQLSALRSSDANRQATADALSARALLVLARAADARALLSSVDRAPLDESTRALLTEGDARANMLLGDHTRALELATTCLDACDDPRVCARLHETAGMSASYLGDETTAAAHLERALGLHEQLADSRGAARTHTYAAIASFRRGAWEDSVAGYRRAIEIAERNHDHDQLPVLFLNLGTALQESGDWGSALDMFERASRLARIVGNEGTRTSARFGLANLFAEVGLFDRAAVVYDGLSEPGATQLDGPLARLGAEIAWGQGRLADAARGFVDARQRFETSGAVRDVAECDLWLARVARLDERPDDAADALDSAKKTLASVAADDLKIRVQLEAVRLVARDADSARGALPSLVDAYKNADRAGLELLLADIDAALAGAYGDQGLAELSDQHRRAAVARWQRVEASLPPEMKAPFERHPRRAELLQASAAPAVSAPADPSDNDVRLKRFFAVNRKLSAALDIEEVLEAAVDAAIELTAAERGFVLLDGERQSLQVAAARDVGGVVLPMADLKFSRSIAERVLAEGRQIVTVDAQRDERFRSQRSVHQMGLSSVACVPIQTGGRVLGALYLDDRFASARFGPADLEILDAFAQQVAIALRNAELHADLIAQRAALEQAQAELRTQVVGQAAQIADLAETVRTKQQALELQHDYSKIIGRSSQMRDVLSQVDRLVDSDINVLIHGESGTGKELLAKAIHYNGPRRAARLLSLNCAALPDNLIESELFGHTKGAFTGADHARKGLLVAAGGGTVFLDEVGEMALTLQAKLLRAIEERTVRPVGADEPVSFDARFLFATHRNLEEEVEAGRFRRDLFFRIGVFTLEVPALRERPDDLPPLIRAFLERNGARSITQRAVQRLLEYAFPGNVRELDNIVTRACLMCDDGKVDVQHLQLSEPVDPVPAHRGQFDDERARQLRAALYANDWNVSQVARDLGLPRQTLYRRMRRYGLHRPA